MTTIDAAIDDYLHTIVRTRPWTKKREGELLEAFSDWLYAQPVPSVALNEIGPNLVDQYAAAMVLNTADHNELLAALNNVYMWSVHSQLTNYNPFAAVAV